MKFPLPSRPARHALTLILILTAAGCSGPETDLQEARELYLEGRYEEAMTRFDEVRVRRTDSGEAHLGHARSAAELHLYDQAIPAYEIAVQLAPENGLAWEGYAQALAWGGLLKGRQDRLEKGMQVAHEALLHVRDRVGIYDHLATAAGNLGVPSRHQAILEDLHRKFPDAPVLGIRWWDLRLEGARRGDGEQDEETLRAELAAQAAGWGEVPFEGLSPPEVYRLWMAHRILDDTEAAEDLAGRVRDRGMRGPLEREICFSQFFLNDLIEAMRAQDGQAMLELVRATRPRYPADWDSGTRRMATLMGYEAQALRDVLGDAGELAAEDPRLDRLVEVTRANFRFETYGRLSPLYQTADLLLSKGVREETALDLAEEGLAALREGRPALFYPGSTASELVEAEKSYLGRLLRVKGQALHRLERTEDAREALASAVELDPNPRLYAAYADLLADQGDDQGAYEARLTAAALAERESAGDVASYREHLAEAAAASGIEAGDLGLALERRVGELMEEYRTRLVEDRLDEDPPAFALEDLGGKTWRLSDLDGKVVVLNYWATWCGPCIQEMPFYEQLVEEYEADGRVKMLAVNTDQDRSLVRPFLEEKGYDFTVVFDEGTQIELNITGIPTTIILGAEGRIQYRQVGFMGEERYLEEMRLRLDALLEEADAGR